MRQEFKNVICIIQYSINKAQFEMLTRCVQSFKKNEPVAQIFVINNSSPYSGKLDDPEVITLDAPNRRELGAIAFAYENIKAEKYLFVHDGTESAKSLPIWEKEFVSLWSFPPQYMIHPPIFLNFLGMTIKKNFAPDVAGALSQLWVQANQKGVHGCFGLMFLSSRQVLEKLDAIGLFKCADDIKCRNDACGTERLIALVLYYLGYPILGNTLQGNIVDYPRAFDTPLSPKARNINEYHIRKFWSGR